MFVKAMGGNGNVNSTESARSALIGLVARQQMMGDPGESFEVDQARSILHINVFRDAVISLRRNLGDQTGTGKQHASDRRADRDVEV